MQVLIWIIILFLLYQGWKNEYIIVRSRIDGITIWLNWFKKEK